MVEHFPLMTVDPTPGGRPLEVRAPYDGTLIATFDTAGRGTVESALARAEALHRTRGARIPARERLGILARTAALMQERAESLAREAAREGGKPLRDSRIEVARAIDGVRGCIECLRTGGGREIPMGLDTASENRLAFTHHEPIGPVVAVSAFNHPLNLIVHQVGPAVAAGNPVIVKPAEDTPISCYRFVALLREAGLPPEGCQALVVEDLQVAQSLVTDSRVAFFSFIGSARVGWSLRAALAPGTRCALEHGGLAPVILAQDADLDAVLPLLVRGGFYHAGQVCVSVQRLYCHRAVVEEVAHRLAEAARALTVGDPLGDATEVGPLIREREVTRVHEWVREARDSGAGVLCGGEPLSASCYAPTVLLEPPDAVRVSREEVFGPVVAVYGYGDEPEVLRRANGLPYAFQAAVMTRDLDRALRLARDLAASAVMINDHTAFRVDWMPFAGLRRSGLGTGGIPYTFHDMQVEKLVVLHSP